VTLLAFVVGFVLGLIAPPVAAVLYFALKDPKARGALAWLVALVAVPVLIAVIAFNVGRVWGTG
jgi:hypothetical protein